MFPPCPSSPTSPKGCPQSLSPRGTRRDENQTILTLGLELEFLLLNLRIEDDPHEIVKEWLEVYPRVSFHTLNPYFCGLEIRPNRFPSLPEVRCDIRLDRVFWFPHGKSTQRAISGPWRNNQMIQTTTRYNRKHFNLMNENGLDPKRDQGVFGPVQEVLPNGDVRYRQSMEVSTPIMREGSWPRVLSSMLDSLRALEKSRLKIEFNKDTGLHLHVGRRGGWSVCQLKKILKAVVIFEEAMDAQHPACRVRSVADQNVTNISSNIERMKIHPMPKLQRVRYVDLKINSRTVRTREEGVMRIYTLTNGNNKCTKYNFLPTKESGTVEFRQAIASLDRHEIGRWVEVVLNFVSAAITTTRKEFEQWAGDMDNPSNNISVILDSFLTTGKVYRHRSVGFVGDFDDELPEDEPEQSQTGAQYYENTYFPRERNVAGRKGKGKCTATDVQRLRDNYEESGCGRNKKGVGESSGSGAQYHQDIHCMSSGA